MARVNVPVAYPPVLTHEGGRADRIDPYRELQRTVLTCMLFEDSFYESGSDTATRIAELIPKVNPVKVAALACEARDRMQLRHVPLFLVNELSKIKGNGPLVAETLAHVIQRADEIAEFMAMYWKGGRKNALSHRGIKAGLAAAFQKFDEYKLAKYNRDNAVKLRDALFLCHAKPKDADQSALWKRLIDGSLATPDTWEVELSAGKDKKETFERLIREGKLGGLALLRNLRNMQDAGVDEALIRERLAQGAKRALPFRFIVAAKHAPRLEDAIEVAMLKATEALPTLPGRTGLLIDISGSMNTPVSAKSEVTRIDAACGVAILLREKTESVEVAAFTSDVALVPSRRGFALRDSICGKMIPQYTYLAKALTTLRSGHPYWRDLDRIIVITDEQSQDGIIDAWVKYSYVINVGPYKQGVSYSRGWTNINGWSEAIIDYIREIEFADEQAD